MVYLNSVYGDKKGLRIANTLTLNKPIIEPKLDKLKIILHNEDKESRCNKERKGVKCAIYFDYEENYNEIYSEEIKQLCNNNKMIKPSDKPFLYIKQIKHHNKDDIKYVESYISLKPEDYESKMIEFLIPKPVISWGGKLANEEKDNFDDNFIEISIVPSVYQYSENLILNVNDSAFFTHLIKFIILITILYITYKTFEVDKFDKSIYRDICECDGEDIITNEINKTLPVRNESIDKNNDENENKSEKKDELPI